MALIGGYIVVPPAQWMFPTHGDVIEGKRRAAEWLAANKSYDGAERYIEEFVRQWALQRLLAAYDYPPEWIGERIIIEEPVKMGSSEKQADISIRNAERRTFLYIEVKKRGISDDEFAEAERQLETYLASTHTATIGMVTDGNRVRVLRKKIDPNDFDYIPDLPKFGLETRVRVQLVRELPETGGDGKKTGLQLIDDHYERILFDCHSAARDADGLHADEALDEICKVIYAKIFDERQITKSLRAHRSGFKHTARAIPQRWQLTYARFMKTPEWQTWNYTPRGSQATSVLAESLTAKFGFLTALCLG